MLYTSQRCAQIFWIRAVRSVAGARRAETIRLSKGEASRIQRAIRIGNAAVKVRKEIIGILHSRPPVPVGVVLHAAPEGPDISCIVQMAGGIPWVTQACITGFAFAERLKPAPVTRGVDKAASAREVFVIGRT
jgi:hypothetical protein